MRKAKQSTAKNVMVLMVQASDHVTGLAGLTLTITSSKDGAAFASIAPTVTDRGSGWYAVALDAGMLDTLGDLALHITGAAADPADLLILVEGGAQDADTSSRMATYVQPTGFLAATFPLTVASTTNITAGTITTVSGNVDGSVGSVTAAVTVGTINANVVNASALAPDAVTEIQSGLATSAALAITTAFIDSEVADIKAQTDQLVFVGGNLNANIKAVNSLAVDGAGTEADPWGPV